MAVLEDRIYWLTKDKGLFSANKFTGRDVQQQLPEMRGIVSLIMMHPALQSMKLGKSITTYYLLSRHYFIVYFGIVT